MTIYYGEYFDKTPPQFNSLGSYDIPNRGKVFIVKNPFECQDFSHLLETEVLIDGQPQKVSGVESFAHAAPWVEGEPIGLLVQ